MAINKFQRSRLTFQPRSLILESRQHIKLFFSEIVRPIKLKYHMQTPYDYFAEIGTKRFCHITKKAAMPIYGKNL